MIRALFIVLAVVVTALAWVMNMPYLYILAGVFVLAAVGLLVANWRRAQRKAEQPYTGKEYTREDDLKSLGIMEVRKKGTRPSDDEAEASSARDDATAQDDARETRSTPASEKRAAKPDASEKRGPAKRTSAQDSASNQDSADAPASGETSSGAEKPAWFGLQDESPQDEDESGSEANHAPETSSAPAPSRPPEASQPVEADGDPESLDSESSSAREASDLPEHAPISEPKGAVALYLETIRAALGAHSAALLVQREMALEYRIEALSSESPQARAGGRTFSTPSPLFSARMTHQAVTASSVGEGGVPRTHLGYYQEPVLDVEHILFAPVHRRDDLATHVLVADATAAGFREARPEKLLERFADLMGHLLRHQDRLPSEEEAQDDVPAERTEDEERVVLEEEAPPGERSEKKSEASRPGADDAAPATSGDGHAGSAARADAKAARERERDDTRPRREIIKEEIVRARSEGTPMALALVYLNRAEAIANNGAAAVEEAERALHEQLRAAAPACRVERFGELTFGAFYNGPVADLERWASDLEEALEAAGAPLDGGASIGIGILAGSDVTPEALRDQAMAALHEAYTTGMCTILE